MLIHTCYLESNEASETCFSEANAPPPPNSLWLPRFKSVRLIKTFSSVLTVVLFWPLSSPHVWKCPVKIKNKEEERTPGRGAETDKEKKHTRQFSRVLELGKERHKFPISTAKHKHLRDCPVEEKSGQASWLTVGSTMARDTNPQTPQTRECQWPADPQGTIRWDWKTTSVKPPPQLPNGWQTVQGWANIQAGAGLNNRPAPVLPTPTLNPLCTGLLGPLLNPPLPKGAQTPKRVCFKLISGTARGGAGEGYPQPGRGFLRFVY